MDNFTIKGRKVIESHENLDVIENAPDEEAQFFTLYRESDGFSRPLKDFPSRAEAEAGRRMFSPFAW